MDTYWDLHPRARATMSDEDFAVHEQRELMEAGIARPIRPDSLDEPDPTQVELVTDTWYEVGPCVFGSLDDAVAFLKLCPYVSASDYKIGYEYSWAEKVDTIAGDIHSVPLYDHDELTAKDEAMKAHKLAKRSRTQARDAWAKATADVTDALSKMAEDRETTAESMITATRLAATVTEFVPLCDGDEVQAMVFAIKANGGVTEDVRVLVEMLDDIGMLERFEAAVWKIETPVDMTVVADESEDVG